MRTLFVVFLLLTGGAALLCQSIVVPAPAEHLVRSGDEIVDSLRRTKQFVTDGTAEAYVRRVMTDILAANDYDPAPFSLYIQNSVAVSAYVLPNAAVIVTSGLLLRLSSREELTMILGHEIGHYVLGHHSAPRDSLLDDANLRSLTQEYEADSVGMAFLQRMDLDPQSGICAVEKLPPDASGLLLDLPFLRLEQHGPRRVTHPPTPRRVELLRKQSGHLSPGECPGSGEYTSSLQALRNDTRWDVLLQGRERNNRTIQIITIDSLLDNTAVEPGSDYYGLLRFQQAEAIVSLMRSATNMSRDFRYGMAQTTYRNNDLEAERAYYAINLRTLLSGEDRQRIHELFSPVLLRSLAELDGMDQYRVEAMRLRGLYYEHVGRFADARQTITAYLAERPTHPARRFARSLLDRMPKKNRKNPGF